LVVVAAEKLIGLLKAVLGETQPFMPQMAQQYWSVAGAVAELDQVEVL